MDKYAKKITKNNSKKILSDGFITFVFVDENGKTIPHGLTLGNPENDEDIIIKERAKKLAK